MSEQIPALHTRQAVAAKYGLPEEWLRRGAIARAIPFHRIGGRNMFTEQDVNEILASAAVKPQTAARPVIPRAAGRPKRSAVR